MQPENAIQSNSEEPISGREQEPPTKRKSPRRSFLPSEDEVARFKQACIDGYNRSSKPHVKEFEEFVEAYERAKAAGKKILHMSWKQIGALFGQGEKAARQEFEKLRYRVSQPPNQKQIYGRIEELIAQGQRNSKKIESQVVQEFGVTQCRKGIRNHIYYYLKKANDGK